MAKITNPKFLPIGIFSGLALLVLLPMLLPGYILTLDMVFTPQLRMPAEVTSSYLFHAALHILNFVLPSQVIQKLMLFAILFLSGYGAYRLSLYVRALGRGQAFAAWGAYLAGALYMINPYTYSRFMAGQYAVLLGYALLPFFVQSSFAFFASPTRKRAIRMALWAVGVGIVSIHTIGLLCIVLAVQLAVAVWRARHGGAKLWAVAKYGALSLAIFLGASAYWMVPLLAGTNAQGKAVAGFTASDNQAFATSGSGVKRVSNALQLRGFWAEDRQLYLLPQKQLPGWPIVMLAIWALVIVGAAAAWRHRPGVVIALAASGLIAVVLAATPLGTWAGQHISLLAGYREPQKFIGLLALVVALLTGMGASSLFWRTQHRQTVFSILIVVVVLLPILYTPTMYWGFAGQLQPRQYPADWAQINTQLNQDHSKFSVLFLPWHLYMSYSFSDRIIASPAQGYFDKPVISSNELEFMGAAPTFPDAQKSFINRTILPPASQDDRLGRQLKPLRIKYIVLAKEFDYRNYDYLNHQRDLKLIRETANLKLYEVHL